MSWSSSRQFKIMALLLILPVCVVGYFVYSRLQVKPTCVDQKKNGTELGVDCGGSCRLQCSELMQDVSVKWRRSFKITDDLYNVGAYVENQNTGVGVEKLKYEFKIYDKDRLLIARREGETFIAPNQGTLIFEEQLKVGNSIPAYTNLEFIGKPVWYAIDQRFSQLVIQTKDKNFDDTDIKPRFSALLKNVSEKQTISGIEAVVALFDKDDTVIQIGKTNLGNLSPLAEKNIFITWQEQLSEKPVRYEVYPQFSPFTQEFVK